DSSLTLSAKPAEENYFSRFTNYDFDFEAAVPSFDPDNSLTSSCSGYVQVRFDYGTAGSGSENFKVTVPHVRGQEEISFSQATGTGNAWAYIGNIKDLGGEIIFRVEGMLSPGDIELKKQARDATVAKYRSLKGTMPKWNLLNMLNNNPIGAGFWNGDNQRYADMKLSEIYESIFGKDHLPVNFADRPEVHDVVGFFFNGTTYQAEATLYGTDGRINSHIGHFIEEKTETYNKPGKTNLKGFLKDKYGLNTDKALRAMRIFVEDGGLLRKVWLANDEELYFAKDVDLEGNAHPGATPVKLQSKTEVRVHNFVVDHDYHGIKTDALAQIVDNRQLAVYEIGRT
ncbi:hypothetical protein ACFL2Y_01940, partial [Candidatus Omnitrophota bacterium]